MREYRAWQEAEQERHTRSPNGLPNPAMLFCYVSEPPEHFFRQAVTGIDAPESAASALDEIITGVATVAGAFGAIAATQPQPPPLWVLPRASSPARSLSGAAIAAMANI